MHKIFLALLLFNLISFSEASAQKNNTIEYDLIICGGTPAGIMTAIAADRMGKTSLLIERTNHIGGLPANGLGATDIQTRALAGGLFLKFVQNINSYYKLKYGSESQQYQDCDGGYHFEASVAEVVLQEMLRAAPKATVLKMHQFDALPENIQMDGSTIKSITVQDRTTGALKTYNGKVFIDATYEGDLIAAAGVPYFVGREGFEEFEEPFAGRVYKYWGGPALQGSSLLADNAIQAFNYRLCLTTNTNNLTPIRQPANYDRSEYVSLIEDVKTGRHTGAGFMRYLEAGASNSPLDSVPGEPKGMQRLVNKVVLPNGKTDANNQHLALISTDLPVENWPWPTSGWQWRDSFAERLRNYTLGLLWFAQHDEGLPESFRQECLRWGLAKDEYQDNDNFPRQVYVREGRRMQGKYFFTALDALPVKETGRPPLHKTSITAGHYAIDSHGVRKRENGRVHLDGFINYQTAPYTVPYEVIVPQTITNLLAPVPVSGTHLGFSTLRMEPTWMALGEAAGISAVLSIEDRVPVQQVDIRKLQNALLDNKAVLIYFEDLVPENPAFKAIQYFALQGIITGTGWKVEPEKKLSIAEVEVLRKKMGANYPGRIKKTGITQSDFFIERYGQVMSEK